jgi:hypothetical protein
MTQKSVLSKQVAMMDEDLSEISKQSKDAQLQEEHITQQQAKLKTEKVIYW